MCNQREPHRTVNPRDVLHLIGEHEKRHSGFLIFLLGFVILDFIGIGVFAVVTLELLVRHGK